MLDAEIRNKANRPYEQFPQILSGRPLVYGCETPESYVESMERERQYQQRAEQDAKRQAEIDAERRVRMLRAMRLPLTESDERRLLRGEHKQTPMLAEVESWTTKPGLPWLVLCGPVGRGKTFAASDALLRCSTGRKYVGARELERISMAKFGDAQEAFEALLSVPFLVVDDIGREDDLGRMQTALLDLVDHRRGAGVMTIAITNFSRKAFCERYSDARLQSRLAECAQWFADVGEDLRRAK